MKVGALIQARMSSSRFPGKVLAPLAGKPVIMHAVLRAREVLPTDAVIVVTSTEESDDPLAAYLAASAVPYFRGPLNDVFNRFRSALERQPFDWFFRICADSPLLRQDLMREMAGRVSARSDLITNVLKRTFPRGHSLELIRRDAFLGVDVALLGDDEREHVTPVFYRNADRYDIDSFENVGATDPISYAVDTVEDLGRLETWLRADLSLSPLRTTVREVRASVTR